MCITWPSFFLTEPIFSQEEICKSIADNGGINGLLFFTLQGLKKINNFYYVAQWHKIVIFILPLNSRVDLWTSYEPYKMKIC